jgi:hypothetical protein
MLSQGVKHTWRSNANPALPYPMRLMSFNLFTFPISDSIALRQGQTSQDGSFVSFNAANEAALAP